MILGPAPGQHMGEGRRPQSMSSQPPVLDLTEMPPQFKTGTLRVPSTFDHNKNSFATHKDAHMPHPQPFTASWLTEVARMTPLRTPERLSFPGGIRPPPSVSDYYQPFQNLPLRPHFYPPPFLAPTYIRDSTHCHHPLRNFSPMDPRPPSEIPRRVVEVSPPLIHPLGPPPPPQPPSFDPRLPLGPRDPVGSTSKDHSTFTEFKLNSPLTSPQTSIPKDTSVLPVVEPNPKRRHLASPLPHSSNSSSPSKASPGVSSWPPPPPTGTEDPFTTTQRGSDTTTEKKIDSTEGDSCGTLQGESTPFHSHFRRGSLVTVGNSVRRVEHLRTSDFVEAAHATEGLSLDPSTIGAISSDAEKGVSNITFIFPSTNKEISVDASNDHPFFVFHQGWSSCNPHSTLLKYDLKVRQLKVGDVCVSLRRSSSTHTESDVTPHPSITDMPPPRQPLKVLNSSSLSSASTCHASTSPLNTTSQSATTSTSDSRNEPTISVLPTSPISVSVHCVSTRSNSCNTLFQRLASEQMESSNLVTNEPHTIMDRPLRNRISQLTQRPASRTADRQKGSDDFNVEERGRKRRWSDPGH